MTDTTTPTDLANEYGAARRRITDLLCDADETLTSAPIPACPAWSVHALCSHVTGIAADLSNRRNPGADVQAWVDAQIADRAHHTLSEVLAEWADVGPRFEALIEAKPASFGGLLYDLIAHEHDLRHAINEPGARASGGVMAAMEMERAMLARDLTSHGLPSVHLLAGGQEFLAGDGTPELELDMGEQPDGVFELFRLLGSRRSHHQLSNYPWKGDFERFLPALAHMPLPEDDVLE